MSAVLEISDRELQGIERDCADEIANRILTGYEWWESFADDPAYHADIVCAVGEALRRKDGDDAMGSIRIALAPMAKGWAVAFVDNHPDVQELAFKLGGIIEYEEDR